MATLALFDCESSILFVTESNRVLVILPVINELPGIKILLPELTSLKMKPNILIVDDGSIDGTREFLTESGKSLSNVYYLRRESRKGIGRAHLDGLNFAFLNKYDFAITMDADLTHNPKDVERVFDSVITHDITFTSRYKLSQRLKRWSLLRRVLAYGGHLVTYLFFKTKVDMSSGLRGYSLSTAVKEVMLQDYPINYDFFFASAHKIIDSGLSYDSIAIEVGSREYGKSKMTFILGARGVISLLRLIIITKLNFFNGRR